MKKLLIALFATVLAGAFVFAPDAGAQKKKTETVVFDAGITCDNCRRAVEAAIPFEKGVKDLKVDVAAKKITVVYDPEKTDAEKIRQAIEKLGYSAKIAEPKKPESPENPENPDAD